MGARGYPNRVFLREVRIIGDVLLLEVKEGLVAHVIEGHVHALHERMQCPRVVVHIIRIPRGAVVQVDVLEEFHARALIPLQFDTRVQLGLLRPSRPTVVPRLPTGVGAVFRSVPAVTVVGLPVGVAPAAWRGSRHWTHWRAWRT